MEPTDSVIDGPAQKKQAIEPVNSHLGFRIPMPSTANPPDDIRPSAPTTAVSVEATVEAATSVQIASTVEASSNAGPIPVSVVAAPIDMPMPPPALNVISLGQPSTDAPGTTQQPGQQEMQEMPVVDATITTTLQMEAPPLPAPLVPGEPMPIQEAQIAEDGTVLATPTVIGGQPYLPRPISPTRLFTTHPYVCEEEGCGKHFKTEHQLRFHMNHHRSDRGEENDSLRADTSRQRRPLTQTGKRSHMGMPVLCTVCQKMFAELGALKKHHLRKHADEKPYQCVRCAKKFSVDSDRKAHEKWCGTQFPCSCGLTFSSARTAKWHQKQCPEHEMQWAAVLSNPLAPPVQAHVIPPEHMQPPQHPHPHLGPPQHPHPHLAAPPHYLTPHHLPPPPHLTHPVPHHYLPPAHPPPPSPTPGPL